MKRQFLLLLVAVVVVGASCSNNDVTGPSGSVIGSGVMETESRTFDAVHSVSLRITGEIELTQGAEQSVIVTADDNIIEFVETIVRDGVLIIRTNTDKNLVDYDLIVKITIPDLQSIAVPGVGVVRMMNQFDVDKVDLDFTGTVTANLNLRVKILTTVAAGTVVLNLSGSANLHDCELTGIATISSYDLSTVTTDISVAGTGEIQIQVSEQLTATITGLGNVHYKGHPNVDATITGLGSVNDAN